MEQLDQGVFAISIDVEFGWGMIDTPMTCNNYAAITAERDVVRRLLALFKTYDVHATWAIVGHLMLDHVARRALVLPGMPPPEEYSIADDLFDQVSEACRDVWCVPDVVEMIRDAEPAQEIGSHSFSHLRYDERLTRREVVIADVAQFVRVHNARHLPYASFVFPYNCVGYLGELAMAGVRVVRSIPPKWYDGAKPRILWRLLNLLTVASGVTPKTTMPVVRPTGIVDIPGSMLWYGTNGMRRFIPDHAQVRMAKAGIDAAARTQSVFHLWFHPSNFVHDMERQLKRFELVLRHARKRADSGVIQIMSMDQLARRFHADE